MKKERSSFFALLLSLAAAFCLSLGFVFSLAPTKAVAAENGFYMVGATARLDEKSGIRFTARLNASAYDKNDEYYVMIFPYDWFGDYFLSFGIDYYDELINEYGIPSEDILIMRSEPVLQSTGEYAISGSISNVLYENSNREFFGIAYKQTASGERVYAAENGCAVQSLAGAAVAAQSGLGGYTEDEENELNDMIRRAYNQLCGKAEDKQGAVVFETNTARASLSKGDTGKLFVPYAEELGFHVQWNSEDESKATVDENGNVTALVDSGVCKITARVYGQTCSTVLMFRPAMAENVLEDFSHEGSALNLNQSRSGAVSGAGSWLKSFEGAQGVGLCTYYKSMNVLAVRFNRSLDYLKNLEFDSITVRLYMDWERVERNGEVTRTHALQIGTKEEYIPTKEWYDFTVTKNELISSREGATAAERYQSFCETFSNTGSGRFLMSFHDGHNSIPIYIDSITFGFVEIEEKSAPTVAGETFELPTAKLVAGETVLTEEYEVRVRVGETEMEVSGGAIVTQSGTTTVEYTFVYNGITYKKTYTFDIR